jgi:hypothetical protein
MRNGASTSWRRSTHCTSRRVQLSWGVYVPFTHSDFFVLLQGSTVMKILASKLLSLNPDILFIGKTLNRTSQVRCGGELLLLRLYHTFAF